MQHYSDYIDAAAAPCFLTACDVKTAVTLQALQCGTSASIFCMMKRSSFVVQESPSYSNFVLCSLSLNLSNAAVQHPKVCS
jgi:hypothetical protein